VSAAALDAIAHAHGTLVAVCHDLLDAAEYANAELTMMLARLAAVLHVDPPDVATSDEVDALMADLGDLGTVTLFTERGGFVASFCSTDGMSRGTFKGATVLECLRQIHGEVVYE